MKIIFMGNAGFFSGNAGGLIEAGHEVCLVVTQPDKPKGRGERNAAHTGESSGNEAWNPGVSAEEDQGILSVWKN